MIRSFREFDHHLVCRSVFRAALAAVATAFALSSATASAEMLSQRYVERTLAEHYERLASETARNFLPTDQYRIIVDVLLDPNVDLKQVQSELRREPLPGLTIGDTRVSERELFGRLESLPHRRELLVVFSSDVQKDAQDLVKEALTGKLKLNLAGNVDAIKVRGGRIYETETGDGRAPASAESGWPWGFSVTVALITLILSGAYLAYRWIKRRENDKDGAAAALAGAPAGTVDGDRFAGDLKNEEEAKDADKSIPGPRGSADRCCRLGLDGLARLRFGSQGNAVAFRSP